MNTGSPIQDAQYFISMQESREEDLRECGGCEEMVPADEISSDTDYLGKSCGCRG